MILVHELLHQPSNVVKLIITRELTLQEQQHSGSLSLQCFPVSLRGIQRGL